MSLTSEQGPEVELVRGWEEERDGTPGALWGQLGQRPGVDMCDTDEGVVWSASAATTIPQAGGLNRQVLSSHRLEAGSPRSRC